MNEAELELGDVPTMMRVQRAEFWHKQGGGERKVVDRKVTKQIEEARVGPSVCLVPN